MIVTYYFTLKYHTHVDVFLYGNSTFFFFFIEFYLPCLTFQIEKFVFQRKTALMNM